MPYMLEGKCVYKKKPDGSRGESMGCSDSVDEAKAHMRALYAHAKDSVFAEMSLAIVKASFNTNEPDPNKRMCFRMSSSDVGKDLADESMSLELFKSFTDRIKTNIPIPNEFQDAICEESWCGGMPYLSIAHYKSGGGKNVPGVIDDVFVDGNILKSKGYLNNTPLGHAVYDSLLEDATKRKSGVTDFNPVRVSIGFLDLKHKHLPSVGGQEFIFTRKGLGDICPLCEQGIGGKIYLDGILVHEAMTRVPMNPRTIMLAESELEEKSDMTIQSKKDDARSIVKDLADTLDMDELEQKSILVVKADGVTVSDGFKDCFDPNTGTYNQDCIDKKVAGDMVGAREQTGEAVKSQLLDGVLKSVLRVYKANGIEKVPMEVIMEEKMQLGGENVPVQPFKYDGVESPPHELNKAPVKAKTEDESPEEDKKGDEKEAKMEKSALDVKYDELKSLMATGKATADDVNRVFSELGTEVEKSYTPPAPDMSNLAEVVRSAVEAAVAPLRIEIATLKSQKPVAKNDVPASRALRLQPQDLIQKAAPQPQRKLTQIEMLARHSTFKGSGLQDPLENQQ